MICLLCLLIGSLCPTLAFAETQTLNLEAGWNLIAVQVDPTDPNPEVVFGTVPGLVSAWSYDNATKRWLVYNNPIFDPAAAEKNALPGVGLPDVTMGSAYWVQMSINRNLIITGTKPRVASPVTLVNGWNLIGIPITGPPGNTELTEDVPIISALALRGLDYDLLLKWQEGAVPPPDADAENIGYNRSQFGTTEEDTINEEEFRFFDPNRAYLIHVTEPVNIQPNLLRTVRGETDVSPIGNFPNGPEDVVLQGGAVPVSANEQTLIVFFPDEDVQQLSFSNEGGGVMVWDATWATTDLLLQDAVTLSFNRTADDGTASLKGVTTTETETVYLRVDRTNLSTSASPYTGTLLLRTNAGDVTFDVRVDVGRLRGEWSGFAEITSVNGKRNPVPDIDLNLSFFEDADTPGLLRGAIDSTQSVLWPVDVQLIGHITKAGGNGFQLGGAFVLPPGDQNNEPFDQWDPSAEGSDIDWNDDGFNPSDRINPFPFPIYRSVLLEGQLIHANAIDDQGYVIEGTYREVIYGMMREPIQLEGRFTLNRRSPIPFDSLRNTVITSGSGGTSPVVSGPIPARRVIAHGSSTPEVAPIPIPIDMVLQDVRVSFSLKGSGGVDLPSTNIEISLEAPDRSRLVLHDGSELDPTVLVGASYPNALTPLGSSPTFDGFIKSVSDTSGDWRLHVNNNSGATIEISNVKIVLVGQPFIDVHGRVADSSGQPVAGADIVLNGLPISQFLSELTDSDGRFVLTGIPAMPVNLASAHPAYTGGDTIVASQLVPTFEGTVANPAEARAAGKFTGRPLPAVPVASLGIAGFTTKGSSGDEPLEIQMERKSGPVQISAFPKSGVAPLAVTFYAVGADTGAPINWDLGTGATGSGVSTSHTFDQPGVYEVTATHAQGAASTQITVLPSLETKPSHPDLVADPGGEPDKYQNADDYAFFVFLPRFHGGGSLPVVFPDPVKEVPPQDYPVASPAAEMVMLQHTYTASMDIDLAPFTAGPGSFYSSDAYQEGPVYWSSHLNNQPDPGNSLTGIPAEDQIQPWNDPGWTYEDHNYVLWGSKWFIDGNGNGSLDPGEDDVAGLTGYKYDSSGDNDANFENPRPTSIHGEPFRYYTMACSIGATISPVGISGASVLSADADPVTSPPLEAGPQDAGIATNLVLRMSTNLLGIPVGINPEAGNEGP